MMDDDLWDKFFRVAGVALLLIVPLAMWKIGDIVYWLFMHIAI